MVNMRVFVTAHKNQDFTAEDFAAHLKAEEDHCLELYADGSMREILRRSDGKGAILIMDVESEEQARKICADLPYAKLGMLSFDIHGTLPGLWPLIPSS
jgi:muconolactone delta-isomerase